MGGKCPGGRCPGGMSRGYMSGGVCPGGKCPDAQLKTLHHVRELCIFFILRYYRFYVCLDKI